MIIEIVETEADDVEVWVNGVCYPCTTLNEAVELVINLM